MTREEALKTRPSTIGTCNDTNCDYEDEFFCEIMHQITITAIYDDFESRICENCMYYHHNIKCIHKDLGMMIPPKDFGCNKFKRKTNG